MSAKEGDLVRITYACILDDGTTYDYQESRDPLEFTIGEEETIPALEHAVIGMSPGETKQVKVAAEELTGVTRETLMKRLRVDHVPAEISAVPAGFDFGPGSDGDVAEVLVPQLAAAKYSLVGKDVTLEVKLIEIVEQGS